MLSRRQTPRGQCGLLAVLSRPGGRGMRPAEVQPQRRHARAQGPPTWERLHQQKRSTEVPGHPAQGACALGVWLSSGQHARQAWVRRGFTGGVPSCPGEANPASDKGRQGRGEVGKSCIARCLGVGLRVLWGVARTWGHSRRLWPLVCNTSIWVWGTAGPNMLPPQDKPQGHRHGSEDPLLLPRPCGFGLV